MPFNHRSLLLMVWHPDVSREAEDGILYDNDMRVNPIPAVLDALRATLRELESGTESACLRLERHVLLQRIAELERLNNSSHPEGKKP